MFEEEEEEEEEDLLDVDDEDAPDNFAVLFGAAFATDFIVLFLSVADDRSASAD